MRKIYKSPLYFLSGVFLLLASVSSVGAAPTNSQKAENNPQIVSNYQTGDHTVVQPDNSIAYGQLGADVVMEAGEDKTFQQWYEGQNGETVHTVWRNIGTDTQCPANWLFIQNPQQPPTGDTWGYHFPDGSNYCVKSN